MTWKPSQINGDEITPAEWNEFAQCLLNVSGNAIPFSSNTKTLFAGSSQVKSRFPGSSTAIVRYADSSNIRYRFKGSSNRWNFVSSQSISGQWKTPIYRGKPTAAIANCGQIIRTSGSTGEKTYVWMSVKNDANIYEWIQLGVST